MSNKRISELPYIPESEISGNTLVPLVTYYSAVTGTTVHTYVDDLQNYIINNGYFTSGSSGSFSLKANNDSGLDAVGDYSFSVGINNQSIGNGSHTEGRGNTANGLYSHAEGNSTTADGNQSHSEGSGTQAIGNASHSEGRNTLASGDYSHSEGLVCVSIGLSSHAEGNDTMSIGDYSHAEGETTTSSGDSSHSQNAFTESIGKYSHSGGKGYDATYKLVSWGQTSFVHSEATTTTQVVAYGKNSSILGGIDHLINAGSDNASVIGGNLNRIGSGCTSSSIIGGTGNTIANNVSNTTILGGSSISATSANTVYVPSFVIYTEYEPISSADPAGEPGSITWSSNTDKLYYKTANGWLVIGGTTF